MHFLAEVFTKHPELAAFFPLGIGCWIGGFKLRGFSRGRIFLVRALGRPAAVALALALAACGPPPEPHRSATAAPPHHRLETRARASRKAGFRVPHATRVCVFVDGCF